MPNLVTSVFQLENDRGFFVPELSINYVEGDAEAKWFINCGGTRAYLVRINSALNPNFEAESADSHFMVNRVVIALLLSGFGLFRAKARGRLIFEDIVSEEIRFQSLLDLPNIETDEVDQQIDDLADWYKFLCTNSLFRRAADDAYAALLNPVESIFHVYRGMEWLLKAGNIGWRELAEDIGVSFNQMKEFKRMANSDLGQRHGIASGLKMRAEPTQYGSLITDFVYGICKVRKRVDNNYEVPTAGDVAKIMLKALPVIPYP